MSQEYERASDFVPLRGEANFPPPLEGIEVVGGMHIAPECITRHEGRFVMAVWPNGLPRHETRRVTRFPHGLMMFGERLEECARRLLADQLGLELVSSTVLEIDSYVDDANHWHLEPLLLLEAEGEPRPPKQVEAVIHFDGPDLPEGAIWSDDWRRVWVTHLADRVAPR